MPITPTYPGVYIEEIPSGARTISGVASSIAAFIGRAKRGPINEPTTIHNFGDFERIFGGHWEDSSLGFAVHDFYLNGGGQAVIVRLYHVEYSESEYQTKYDEHIAEAQAAADAVAAAATSTTSAPTKNDMLPAAETARDGYSKPHELAAANVVVTAIEGMDFSNTRNELTDSINSAAAGAAEAQAVINAVTEAVNAIVVTHQAKAKINTGDITFEAANEGSWGNSLQVRITHHPDDETNTLFHLFVRDGITGEVEEYYGLSITANDPYAVDKVLLNNSDLIRIPAGTPLPNSLPEESNTPAEGEDPWAVNDPVTYFGVEEEDEGSDGEILDHNDFIGSGKSSAKEGLYALEKADLFNLLCIPPYKDTSDADTTVIDAATAYCEKRRAFMIIDAPSGWTDKDAAIGGIDDFTASKNAGIFFPRIRRPNPLKDNAVENFAPCGAVAGVIARTDGERGVWKAPAGISATFVNVPGFSVPLTDDENGELNPLGVNCLRDKPPAGRIIWGSRTLFGNDELASEWKYLPIRRLALNIEESLFRGTQWIVFEPNDEPLWAQIRMSVGGFMNRLFRQGAFQGSSPAEAYFVKCDKETTTQNDINRGIVNILVGFAPLKPAEFVILKIQQIAGESK